MSVHDPWRDDSVPGGGAVPADAEATAAVPDGDPAAVPGGGPTEGLAEPGVGPRDAVAADGAPDLSAWATGGRPGPRGRGRRLVHPADQPAPLSPEQRLLLLDTWQRSGLPAGDFAALVGVSKHTLYAWKKKFDAEGPAGLEEKGRGAPTGSRLPEVTRRAILMMKEANPDWGVEKISALLLRGPALPASPQAVARVLHEAGYELEEAPWRVAR